MHKIYGHGPIRAIFLHGWFGTSADYGWAVTALDPNRFSICLPDFPGFGARKDEGGPYTVDGIARDALAIADGLGWDRFSIVGHSMGGKAALRVAALAPARVERICGITPVGASPVPFDEELLGVLRAAAQVVDIRQGVIDQGTSGKLSPHWCRQMALDSEATSRTDAFAAYFESWAHDDFSSAVAGLSHPALALVGALDTSVTEDAVRATWLSLLPNARLERINNCGHYPTHEAPVLLGTLIGNFLDPSD